MKAMICEKYGPPEVLQLHEVKTPQPKDHELQIKIHAAAVNTGDCEVRRFQIMPLFWLPLRLYLGVFKPRKLILGQEVAGEVTAVGRQVKGFSEGDKVMAQTGFVFGGYAEYVCLPVKYAMTTKPANMRWEQAACVTVGGCNALHFLRKAKIQPGQKVLIYGSTGSIGTFAVQLAKYYGAHVTAVCSTAKIDLVQSLGADAVIDYTKGDVYAHDQTYDVIFDTIGKSPFRKGIRSLKPDGVYLQANPTVTEMLRGGWVTLTSRKKVVFEFADHVTEDLVFLSELIKSGKLKAVVDRTYPLEQAVEAHRYVEQRHKSGNVVLTMDHGTDAP